MAGLKPEEFKFSVPDDSSRIIDDIIDQATPDNVWSFFEARIPNFTPEVSSFGRKSKCLLIVLAKLIYLDRVGRADFSGCHLEEIWLFVTGLSHPNGNLGESTKIWH